MKTISSKKFLPLALCLFLSSCSGSGGGNTPSLLLAPAPAPAAKFEIGVCTHMLNKKFDPNALLSLSQDAGVVTYRDDMSWDQIETRKGEFVIPEKLENSVNLAISKGIHPLAILDYGNKFHNNTGMPQTDAEQEAFVRYAEFVADHFHGRIKRFEIWNEWNIGGGNSKRYVMVKSVYRGLLLRGSEVDLSDDPDVMAMIAAYEAKTITRDKMITDLFNSPKGMDLYPADLPDNAFIDRLYGNCLHRPPNSAERAAVLASLGSGVPRSEVARKFVLTAEYSSIWRPTGDIDVYMRLLQRTTKAIRRIDPGITIIGGAVGGKETTWLERMVKAGALDYADALSIHPYNFGEGAAGNPENLVAWLDGLEKILMTAANGKEVPLYITEIGWPNHIGTAGTPPQVTADYLARFYILARTKPFIKGIYWYDLQDDGTDPANGEHNFGLVGNDLTPKPAYHRLKDISRLVGYADFVERLPTDQSLQALRFRNLDGTTTVALWSTKAGGSYQVMIDAGDQPSKTAAGVVSGPVMANGKISLDVAGMPVLVNGDFGQLKVSSVWKDEVRQ